MRSTPIYAFDAYGTLLNVHAAVARHAAAVGPDAGALSDLWRTKQLEYSWVGALMGRYEPFWTLTERALDHAMARLPSVPKSARAPLLDAYRSLGAYPEVHQVLRTLRARGARCCVLSNGNPEMLQAAFDAANLTDMLDRLISVDAAKTFKTSPSVYGLVTQAYDVPASQVTMVSSNRWDIAGAVAYGFEAVWVNRGNLPDEYPGLVPKATCNNLNELLNL
jgi:2-haloacid dehalogenase